jgi:predicted nucleotidyltransferase
MLQPAHSPSSGTAASPSPARKSEMMEKMGIEVGNGRISIDTQKTRSFLEAIERQISSGMNRGVQKAKQHQDQSGVEDIGIHVGKDRIEIDLNKTKKFMEIWGESMKILGKEIEKSLQAPQ